MAAVVLPYAALRAGMGPDAVALAVGCLTLVLGCVLLALGIRERATGNSNRGISVLALLFLARSSIPTGASSRAASAFCCSAWLSSGSTCFSAARSG